MKLELTAHVSDDHVAGSPSDERAVRRASIYDKKAFTIDHEARTSKLGNLKALEPGLISRLQHDCIAIERPNFELLATERYDYRDCQKPLVAEGV